MIGPVDTPIESHVSTQSRELYHVKPTLGLGRSGIKKKIPRFPIPLSHDKQKQPKLLPGRKPIIQITERPVLQPSKVVAQPKNCQKSNKCESLVFLIDWYLNLWFLN